MKHNIQSIFALLLFVFIGTVICACGGDWEADDSLLTDEIHGSLTNHHVVATGEVKDVTHNSATILLSANHNYKESLEIKPGIVYSEENYREYDFKYGKDNISNVGVDNFNSSECEAILDNLKPSTKYYYRAYAVADGEYHYGEIRSFTTTSDYTPGEAVDLGLSVKWANRNIGASQPEQFGISFYWGETLNSESKDWHEFSLSTLINQGYIDDNNNLSSSYDTAAQIWGSKWRMPTKDEFQELIDKCTWKNTIKNGVNVFLITGPNSNVIYLPYASEVDYWSSSSSSANSYYLNFYSTHSWSSSYDYYSSRVDSQNRYIYDYIRPVLK